MEVPGKRCRMPSEVQLLCLLYCAQKQRFYILSRSSIFLGTRIIGGKSLADAFTDSSASDSHRCIGAFIRYSLQELKLPYAKPTRSLGGRARQQRAPRAGAHMQPTNIPRTWGHATDGDLNATRPKN